MKWSPEETELLISALRMHGKDYSLIANIIFDNTRTILQVKNRTSYLLLAGQVSEQDIHQITDNITISHDEPDIELEIDEPEK